MARSRPHAPRPSEAHSNFIDNLGGPLAVAAIVSDHHGLKGKERLSGQAVSQWKKRGIPYAYRACLAIRARELSVSVPDAFLNERARS